MDAAYFKNRLRGLKIVLAFLEAESEDELCRGCIGFDGAATKVKKGFKKLKLDLQGVEGLEEEKKALVAQIDELRQQAERLPEANDPT